MKIRIKAGSVEIEYEEVLQESSYYFMLGKGNNSKSGNHYKDDYMGCLKGLIDGVGQLLQAQQATRD